MATLPQHTNPTAAGASCTAEVVPDEPCARVAHSPGIPRRGGPPYSARCVRHAPMEKCGLSRECYKRSDEAFRKQGRSAEASCRERRAAAPGPRSAVVFEKVDQHCPCLKSLIGGQELAGTESAEQSPDDGGF